MIGKHRVQLLTVVLLTAVAAAIFTASMNRYDLAALAVAAQVVIMLLVWCMEPSSGDEELSCRQVSCCHYLTPGSVDARKQAGGDEDGIKEAE